VCRPEYATPVPERAREALIREKALLLRSIKELEFDKSMGKIGESDYAEISGRLRARALSLMQDIERAEAPPARTVAARSKAAQRAEPGRASDMSCAQCGTANPDDAKFCKNCGTRLVV
jgi:hypothetical protein